MTDDGYKATISSNRLKYFGGWSVNVDCNDLEVFKRLCDYIKKFEEIEKV